MSRRRGKRIGSVAECSWCGAEARKRGSKQGVFCNNSNKCSKDYHAAKKGCITTIEIIWLLIEQQLQCAYCDRRLPPDLMEPDHMIPRAAGGTDDIENISASCCSCNRSKGSRSMEQFMKTGLRWEHAPDLTEIQAVAALLHYARHKRITARCKGILDGRVKALSPSEEAVSARVLNWLISAEREMAKELSNQRGTT